MIIIEHIRITEPCLKIKMAICRTGINRLSQHIRTFHYLRQTINISQFIIILYIIKEWSIRTITIMRAICFNRYFSMKVKSFSQKIQFLIKWKLGQYITGESIFIPLHHISIRISHAITRIHTEKHMLSINIFLIR